MLALSAVLLAAVTLLLVEGSIVFYRLPSAPRWLRERKGLQINVSTLLSLGLIGALLMMGQYLVELGEKPFDPLEIGLACLVATIFTVVWRRLRKFDRRVPVSEDAPEPDRAAETTRRAA